ncbi:MAG: hypothetical protein AB8B64_07875 [Granulosicoccus sp.]
MSTGLVSALALCTASFANILPEFEPVNIEPGELFEQVIGLNRNSGMKVEIRLLSPPDGAHIALSDDGQLKLKWETGPDLPAQTQLTIQARDIDTQSVVETRKLDIHNRSDVRLDKPGRVTEDEGTSITLGPMANQIVSSGQTVMITLNASSNDDAIPLISLDRVPSNATFGESPLGGYTFFWQTEDSDQGEHIFRVTAQHPSESEVSESALLTVFIGDPSRSKTMPATKAESKN